MSVAGIGAGGALHHKYQMSTVNVDDLINAYKGRRASVNHHELTTVKATTKQRRGSFTGIAMYCDTAIDYDHTSHTNGIQTLSERVTVQQRKYLHFSNKISLVCLWGGGGEEGEYPGPGHRVCRRKRAKFRNLGSQKHF